jgi:hypothetical protein
MKTYLIFSIFLLALHFDACNCSAKVLRFDCNSSNLTVINAKCRVRSLSRTIQNFNIQFEVKNKVDRVLVNSNFTKEV